MAGFVEGLLAGYGIAVPVGVIAILIIQTGLEQGLRRAFVAGAGAATADLIYAGLAALAGAAAAPLLTLHTGWLRIVTSLLLLSIGIHGLRQVSSTRKRPPADQPEESRTMHGLATVYARFLGLTLLNPLTVAYFTALILGGGGGYLNSDRSRAVFVLGAGLASLSWQSVLAAIGALGHRQLGAKPRRMISAAGNLVVVALGLRMLIS